jgi:hypothetical protein
VKRKKLEKKLKAEMAAKAVKDAELKRLKEEEADARRLCACYWGTDAGKSKKNKGKGAREEFPPPPSEAEPKTEPVLEPSPAKEEEDPWAMPLASSKKISSNPDLRPTESFRDVCPLRAQHLENDQWMECKQCRAVLQQVAEQLVHRDFYEQGTGRTRQSIGLPGWIF